MRRKSDNKGLLSGLTFSTALVLFGVFIASGAVVGLVVSKTAGPSKRAQEAKALPPIRAVHIKPDLTKIKKETATAQTSKEVMMSPAMLRQMSIMEQRIARMEGHIKDLSKINMDLAEKVDTSGLKIRLEALEDGLKTFTASVDKQQQELAKIRSAPKPIAPQKPEPKPRGDEITSNERKLLPPPFKTDTPKDVAALQPAPAPAPAPAPKVEPKQVKTEQEKLLEKLSFTDLSKPQIKKAKGKYEGWEAKVILYKKPAKLRVAQKSKPRFSTQAASKEITGTIKPSAPKKSVKKTVPKKERFAVHIASSTTLYRAKDSWLELRRDNGILRGLTPHIVSTQTDKRGAISWKLLAGPLKNEDQAAKVCTRLKAKGKFCRRTALSGTPLKF